MRRALVLIVGLVFSGMWWGETPDARTPAAPVEPALVRFLSRPDEPLTAYRAVRHMEAENARFNLRGALDAMTTLSADGHFEYTILRETGSDYIRSKVLKSVLENEEKLFATTDPSRAALTTSNYDLNGAEPAEPGVVRLFAKPRRREISLVDGFVFVRQEGSHRSYVRAGTARPVVIPTYDEVPVAVIKSNLKTANLNRDDYFHLLAR